MLVEIRGVELPGRRFECFEGVQVGLRVGKEVLGLVAGDAEHACWETDVRVRETGAGYDFAGDAVRGKRGERALALAWLDDTGELFRAAKLRLDEVPSAILAGALGADVHLVATIRLTDPNGGPLCATVPASHVTWEQAA